MQFIAPADEKNVKLSHKIGFCGTLMVTLSITERITSIIIKFLSILLTLDSNYQILRTQISLTIINSRFQL